MMRKGRQYIFAMSNVTCFARCILSFPVYSNAYGA
jgi:hypothetical protein